MERDPPWELQLQNTQIQQKKRKKKNKKKEQNYPPLPTSSAKTRCSPQGVQLPGVPKVTKPEAKGSGGCGGAGSVPDQFRINSGSMQDQYRINAGSVQPFVLPGLTLHLSLSCQNEAVALTAAREPCYKCDGPLRLQRETWPN